MAGFNRSVIKQLTIPAGTNGINTSVDFGHGYAFFQITIEDAAAAPAASLRAMAAFEHDDSLASVRESNDPSTEWSKTLPSTGKHTFRLDHVFGARRLAFVLSANAVAGGLTISIRGFDPVSAGYE